MQILIVEDDRGISSFLDKGLRAEGYSPVLAGNSEEALAALEVAEPGVELVLLDLGLPSGDGEGVLRRMRQDGHSMPVIVLTATSRSPGRSDIAAQRMGPNVRWK